MRSVQYIEAIRVTIIFSIIPRRQQIDNKVLDLAQSSEEMAWSLFEENLDLFRET